MVLEIRHLLARTQSIAALVSECAAVAFWRKGDKSPVLITGIQIPPQTALPS